MRLGRTPSEETAISLVKRTLTQDGHIIIDDETITDSPDWVFSCDSVRIAAECRCINLEAVMRWANSNRTMKPERCYEIIIPNEPHLWIDRAVADKEGKIEKYKERAQATEIWLIAHSEFPATLPLFEADSTTLDLMHKATAALKTNFNKIWFVHPECGAALLRAPNTPPEEFPLFDLSEGYPIISNKKSIGTVTETGLTIDMRAEPEDVIKLQPLDKKYQI